MQALWRNRKAERTQIIWYSLMILLGTVDNRLIYLIHCLTGSARCQACDGKQYISGRQRMCQLCRGKGNIRGWFRRFLAHHPALVICELFYIGLRRVCPACNGAALVAHKQITCKKCSGSGRFKDGMI